MAAGAVNTMRQLGFAFGVAVLGSVFTARAQGVLAGHGVPSSTAAARAVAGGQAPVLLQHVPASFRSAASTAVHASAVSGVQVTLAMAGAVGVVAGLLTLALYAPRGFRRMRGSGSLPPPEGKHQSAALLAMMAAISRVIQAVTSCRSRPASARTLAPSESSAARTPRSRCSVPM